MKTTSFWFWKSNSSSSSIKYSTSGFSAYFLLLPAKLHSLLHKSISFSWFLRYHNISIPHNRSPTLTYPPLQSPTFLPSTLHSPHSYHSKIKIFCSTTKTTEIIMNIPSSNPFSHTVWRVLRSMTQYSFLNSNWLTTGPLILFSNTALLLFFAFFTEIFSILPPSFSTNRVLFPLIPPNSLTNCLKFYGFWKDSFTSFRQPNIFFFYFSSKPLTHYKVFSPRSLPTNSP